MKPRRVSRGPHVVGHFSRSASFETTQGHLIGKVRFQIDPCAHFITTQVR